MNNLIDITGKKFNLLTPISYKSAKFGSIWLCKCDCGGESWVSGYALRNDVIKSCGCIRVKDLSGQRFGKLLVVKRIKKSKRHIFSCLCDCGNETFAYGYQLRSGNKKSCGCLQFGTKAFNQLNDRNLANKDYAVCILIESYKRGAKARKCEFKLTELEFKTLILQKCFYCGIEPKNSTKFKHKKSIYNISYNGIDRLDNKKGYIVNNCVTCCTNCNFFKRGLGLVEFLKFITTIYENLINDKSKDN